MFSRRDSLLMLAGLLGMMTGCGPAADDNAHPQAADFSRTKAFVPLQVEIKPDSDKLEPNTVVDFRVTVSCRLAIPDLDITIDVPDTLAIYSGDRHWRGQLPMGGKHVAVIAIQVPSADGDTITATAVARFPDGQVMSAKDAYTFGQNTPKGRSGAPSRETQRNGQSVREYSLP